MGFLFNLDSLFSFYIIRHLTVAIIFILVIDALWRRQNFRFSYAVIRYTILINWIAKLLFLLFGYMQIDGLNRASGPYWWIYLIMLISSLILPALLIHKKWGRNKWFLLAVGFLSTLGHTFELFVIFITSWHQNYGSFNTLNYATILIVRPFIITCFIIGIDVIFFRNRSKEIHKPNSTEEILDRD